MEISNKQIKELQQFLQEDIKNLKLSGDQITERVSYYLDNIAGLEMLSEQQYQTLVKRIINNKN